MEAEDVLKLQEVRAELVREVDFEAVAPALLQHRLLTTAEYEALSGHHRDQQVAAMLDLMPAKPGAVLRLLGLVLQVQCPSPSPSPSLQLPPIPSPGPAGRL